MPWFLLKTASLRESLCQNMIALSQWQRSDPFDEAERTHLPVVDAGAAGVKVTDVHAAAAVVDELSFPVVCFRTVESQSDGNLLE